MKTDNITPFVRFSGDLTVTSGQKNMVGYDNRIYFCVSGSGKVIINGTSYKITNNTFLLWKAGSVYSYSSDNYMYCITCNFDYTNKSNDYTVPVPPDHISSFQPQNILSEDIFFEDNDVLNGVIYLPAAPNVRNLMIELRDEFNKNLKYYRLKINALLQEILLEVIRLNDNEFYIKNGNLVNDLLNYIQQEYQNNPSNETISKQFGYHPNYINSLITKHTGLSLHKYLLNCKMSKAIQLLMNSDLGIKEIADSIGIDDYRYFTRLFKQWYNKTPSQFRKKY